MVPRNCGWASCSKCERSKIGRKTRNLHDSIDLCDPPNDLKMQCQWYHEVRPRSGKYRPSIKTVNVDKKFVHVEACLGLVDLEYIDGFYSIVDNGQLGRFKRLMNAIN